MLEKRRRPGWRSVGKEALAALAGRPEAGNQRLEQRTADGPMEPGFAAGTAARSGPFYLQGRSGGGEVGKDTEAVGEGGRGCLASCSEAFVFPVAEAARSVPGGVRAWGCAWRGTGPENQGPG